MTCFCWRTFTSQMNFLKRGRQPSGGCQKPCVWVRACCGWMGQNAYAHKVVISNKRLGWEIAGVVVVVGGGGGVLELEPSTGNDSTPRKQPNEPTLRGKTWPLKFGRFKRQQSLPSVPTSASEPLRRLHLRNPRAPCEPLPAERSLSPWTR